MRLPHEMEWLNWTAEVTSVLVRLMLFVGLLWFLWFLVFGGWK